MAKAKRRKIVHWTKEDVRLLKALAKSRLLGAATAKQLRRTRGAVAQKALVLGVRFRSINRGRPRAKTKAKAKTKARVKAKKVG